MRRLNRLVLLAAALLSPLSFTLPAKGSPPKPPHERSRRQPAARAPFVVQWTLPPILVTAKAP